MLPPAIIPNETAAGVASSDGLNLIISTMARSSWTSHAYHDRHVRRKA